MKTGCPYSTSCGKIVYLLIIVAIILQAKTTFSQETTSTPLTGILKTESVRGPLDNPIPPGWDTYSTAGDPHGIIVMLVANPRIGDIPILPGDYIGSFFEDENGDLKCGGQDIWLGDENIIFGAFPDDDDTPEKDGFLYGEQMYFKIYSYTTLKEYDVTLLTFDNTIYSGTDIWFPLGLSVINNIAYETNFDAYAIATPNPVCIGNQVSLEALIFIGTTGNYTYSWTSDPVGFTSSMQNPTVIPVESTVYLLEVSDGSLVSNAYANVIVNFPATVVAGSDGTICENEEAHLSSTATNYGSLLWTSSGDGSFSDPNIPDPFYTAGPADAEAGFAVLTIQALPLDDCVLAPTDELTVTVGRLPNLVLPPVIDFCENQEIWITADIDAFSSLIWTTSGDGTFSDPNSATTQYFPGSFDQNLGEFTITCCAEATSPCSGGECADMFCTITEASTVNAPSSRTKCENLPVPVNSVAFNYVSSLWLTEGDGYFENPESLATNYIPGPLDISNGGTVVTINAFGFGGCQNHPATKDVNVIILSLPEVDAGDDDVVCAGLPVQLNASVQDYSTFEWSSSGDGYFNSVFILDPTYYPGINDIAGGGCELTLTAQPLAPCAGTVSDTVEVEVAAQPELNITTATNQDLCAGINLQLETTATGFLEILWETTGDGYFSDPNIVNPVYYHGPVTDLSGNPVTLKATAFTNPICGSDVSDQINVSYFFGATSDAGVDFAACSDDLFVSGSAENYQSVLWETDGDGYFEEPGSLATKYIPGNQDLTMGSAQLCLLADGIGDCPVAEDCLSVSITANPVTDIGAEEASICYGEVYSFEESNISHTSSISWFTTNGGGTFDDPGSPNPTYTPDPETDYALGCIQIGVTAQPIAPCLLSSEDFMDLCFSAPPEASTGPDATIVETETYFTEATAANYSGSSWSTSGDGFFENPALLETEYTPGAQDIQNESVQLTFTAIPLNGCPLPASDALTLTIMRQQNIGLQPGWSGFSSFVDQSGQDFENVVSPISSQLVFAQNMTQIYWPEYGINTIGEFNNKMGYKVKLSDEANLPVTGFSVKDKTISLPTGWSILPVLSDCAIPTTELISQLSDKMIILTEIGGEGMLYPSEGIFNLPDLEPGKSYMIKMSEVADFTFPDCTISK